MLIYIYIYQVYIFFKIVKLYQSLSKIVMLSLFHHIIPQLITTVLSLDNGTLDEFGMIKLNDAPTVVALTHIDIDSIQTQKRHEL